MQSEDDKNRADGCMPQSEISGVRIAQQVRRSGQPQSERKLTQVGPDLMVHQLHPG